MKTWNTTGFFSLILTVLFLWGTPVPAKAYLYSHSGQLPQLPAEAHAAGAAFYQILPPFIKFPAVIEFWREQLVDGGPEVPLVRITPSEDATVDLKIISDPGPGVETLGVFAAGEYYENIALHTGDQIPFSGIVSAPTTFILDQNTSASQFDDAGPFDLLFKGINGTANIEIPGPGTAPPWPGVAISVSRSYINFGDVYVGEVKRETVTISNDGDAPLELFDIVYLLYDEPAFSSSNCEDVTLDSGSSCTVTVSFNPPLLREYSGAMIIHSEDPQKPKVSVRIWGDGYGDKPMDFSWGSTGCFTGALR